MQTIQTLETSSLTERRFVHWAFIFLAFFLPLAVTLPWIQFTDSMETFNVLSAVEIARDGSWMVPTLWRQPRLEKPPLVQWLTASGILIGGPLEWSARWITLVFSCLSLIFVYEWGRLLQGPKVALTAAMVAGTSLLFMRFGTKAAYDAHLLFWVCLVNFALTRALFEDRWRWGTWVGGIALGGALLAKGPPALLHTLLPFIACCVAVIVWKNKQDQRLPAKLIRDAASLLVGSLLIASLLAGAWVICLAGRMGGLVPLLSEWRDQMLLAREVAAGEKTSAAVGLVFLPVLMPWTVWFLGTFYLLRDKWQGREGRQLLYLLTMCCLPIVIHSFMPLLRERYLLPMLPPAAIAVAIVYHDFLRRLNTPRASDRLAMAVHWLSLGAMAIGHPLLLAIAGQRGGQIPPMPWTEALGVGLLGALTLIGAMLYWRRWTTAPIASAVIIMLIHQIMYAAFQFRAVDFGKQNATIVRENYARYPLFAYLIRGVDRGVGIHLGLPVQGIKTVQDIPPTADAIMLLDGDPRETMPPGSRLLHTLPTRKRDMQVWLVPADRQWPASQSMLGSR